VKQPNCSPEMQEVDEKMELFGLVMLGTWGLVLLLIISVFMEQLQDSCS
jgi:hypothetical protein